MRIPTPRIALAVALALLASAARPARAQDAVVTWMDVADWVETKASDADRGYRTARNSRAQTQTALAIFEARNAVERRYASFLGGFDAPTGASADAAVAAAAHAVLAALFPGQRQAVDDALTVALAEVPDGGAETAGVDVGKRAAEAVLRRAAMAEGATLAAYRPRTTPGAYIDPGLPSILPFDLLLPPWMLRGAAELRPAGPPALTSERYARDLDEVRRLGAKASTERTPAQTLLAPALLWVDYAALLRDVARRPGRAPLQNARMYALAYMTGDDGWLAVMEAKMHFGTWRPITAIRNADQDGNDRTPAVPDWEPLLRTPTHPDYPCGHCVFAAAVGTVLEAETGPAPEGGIRIRSVQHHPGLVATVPTWKAFVDAMSLSRIHAGAHTRFANEDAEAIGREVARRALTGVMRPLAARR